MRKMSEEKEGLKVNKQYKNATLIVEASSTELSMMLQFDHIYCSLVNVINASFFLMTTFQIC